MTDITVDDMKFDCGGEQLVIPFDPPMKSLREARERVVQLDKDALQLLGRSDITITQYIPPYAYHVLHILHFTLCSLLFVILSRPSHFRPGSWLYDNVLVQVPRLNSLLSVTQPYVIAIMVVAHTVETALLARKLGRHGVTPLQGVWWAWVGSCCIEGGTSFQRMNWLIEEKKREKEAKKH